MGSGFARSLSINLFIYLTTMNSSQDSNTDAVANQHYERDAVSLKFMSCCFIGFSVLLSLALFYEQSAAGRVVNIVSAILLAITGGVCLLISRQLSKKSKQSDR